MSVAAPTIDFSYPTASAPPPDARTGGPRVWPADTPQQTLLVLRLPEGGDWQDAAAAAPWDAAIQEIREIEECEWTSWGVALGEAGRAMVLVFGECSGRFGGRRDGGLIVWHRMERASGRGVCADGAAAGTGYAASCGTGGGGGGVRQCCFVSISVMAAQLARGHYCEG